MVWKDRVTFYDRNTGGLGDFAFEFGGEWFNED
jgi:hypothetical protein